MTLPEIRRKIDAIDEGLLALLNERADLVHEVGVTKRAAGTEIYAPEREEQVLRSLVERNRASGRRLPEGAIRAIYREIMSASLALEKDLAIAYFGPEAAETHHAARQKFGSSVRYVARASISEVFEAVARGSADYGVLPSEDSAEGTGNHTLAMFLESDLRICAQILLPIGDAPRGGRRFLVLGRSASPPTGRDRTAFVLCVRDEPGALLRALEPLNRAGISIRQMVSRPSRRQAWEYYLFVEADGHASEAPLQAALAESEPHCVFLKVFGAWPETSRPE